MLPSNAINPNVHAGFPSMYGWEAGSPNRPQALRPLMLVFGNSIADQNLPSLTVTTATVTADTRAGATTLPVSTTSYANGDKIAITLAGGELFLTTVSALALSML